MSKEHDAREVEALAGEVRRVRNADHAVARFILDREAALVGALEDAESLLSTVFCTWYSDDGNKMTMQTPAWNVFGETLPMARLKAIHAALAAHRASTRAPEPTLREAVESMLAAKGSGLLNGRVVNEGDWLAVQAALARERGGAS